MWRAWTAAAAAPLRVSLSAHYRTALVTGAASGLGAAFAEMLVHEGVRVWGTSRDPARLAGRAGVQSIALELGDAASVEAAWSGAERASGGIDLLVNNAGAGLFGEFGDLTPEDWDKQIAVLLLGPARLAARARAAMRARDRGCIVNVASIAVDYPLPFQSAYNAAKAGLAALSASLALDADGSPPTVIDFRPGDHRTNFMRAMTSSTSPHALTGAQARAWRRLEALLASSPPPEAAARDLRRALQRGRSGLVRSGTFFQAVLAPFLGRFGSASLRMRLHRRYFHLT